MFQSVENVFAAPVLAFLYSVKSALPAHVTQVWLLYYELDPNVNSSPQRTLYCWIMISPGASAWC